MTRFSSTLGSIRSCLVLGLALAVSSALGLGTPGARAQAFDPRDPFRGGRALLPSGDLVVLHQPASGGLAHSFWDVPHRTSDTEPLDAGDTSVAGFARTGQWVEDDFAFGSPDAVAADFDGDGTPELATAWHSTAGRIAVRVSRIEDAQPATEGPVVFTSRTFAGTPAGYLHQVRVLAGQVDGDAPLELVVVQTYSDGIAAEFFDVDAVSLALTPTRADVTNAVDHSCVPSLEEYGYEGFSVFDAELADTDADGIDELALAKSFESCTTSGKIRGRVNVVIHDEVHGAREVSVQDSEVDVGDVALARIDRVAVAAGEVDGGADGRSEVAVVFENVRLSHGGRITWAAVALDRDGVVSLANTSSQLVDNDTVSSGTYDARLAAELHDFDHDGRSELVIASGRRLVVLSPNTNLYFAPLANRTLGTGRIDSIGLGRLAIADVDPSASPDLATEILVVESQNTYPYPSQRLRVFRLVPVDAQSFSLEVAEPPGQPGEAGYVLSPTSDPARELVLVPADYDGDGVFLGMPRRQVRREIVQPVVVLNAPPVHFDRIEDTGQVVDVSLCWSQAGCGHEAFYTQSETLGVSVENEVTATWATSREFEAEAGLAFPFVEASVGYMFEDEVGRDFSRVMGRVASHTEYLEAFAVRDDRLFGTVADYEIIEYPIYAGPDRAEPAFHAIAVLPGNVVHKWFDGKEDIGLQMLQNHEVGNILSYKDLGDPFENDAVGEALRFVQGDVVTISPTNPHAWGLAFEELTTDQTRQGSYQAVSETVSASVSGGFAGFSASLGASVSGSYGNDSVSTHRITVGTSGEARVDFGLVDGGVTVGGEPAGSPSYEVQPYAYWSYEGALVVDYGVSIPQGSPAVPSLWETLYGDAADLTFAMPWRLDHTKGSLSTPGLLLERTRDIVVNPRRPVPGEDVTIQARVQNYSLAPTATSAVEFYLGDPRQGGTALGFALVPPLEPREDLVVELTIAGGVPGLSSDSLIWARLDPTNVVNEVHEDNNLAWNYADIIGPQQPECFDGDDNDADGLIDFGEDPGCESEADASEASSGGGMSSCGLGSFAWVVPALAWVARRRRGTHRRTRERVG